MFVEPDYKLTYAPNRSEFLACYPPNVYNVTKWKPEPTTFTLPMLYIQIMVMMVSTGVLMILLNPLYQQRLTAALLAGILMGPTALGNIPAIHSFFPFSSLPALTMFKNLGIIFYMFLAGLEMNLTPIVRIRRKTLSIAVVGMIIPFGFGFGSYFILRSSFNEGVNEKLGSAFPWAIALTSTNLPNLVKTLSDLKLLRTDIGRMALSSALLSDIGTWIFLIILIVSTHERCEQVAISTAIFFLVCLFVIRPVLFWLISRASSNKLDSEQHVHYVIFGVVFFSLVADSLGLTAVVGAFVFGFILPSGRLTSRVTEQLGAITNWISIPLYCLDNGLKVNMINACQMFKVSTLATFLAVCWMAKFVSTMSVSLASKMNPREAIALSVLMNSKGLLPIIIINFAKDQLYSLGIETSSAMVVAILLMMVSVPLIVKVVYKPQRRLLSHGLKTIGSIGSDWPLRIIAGVNMMANVHPVMDLAQVSTPTQRSPIYITVVHLVELTDETSAAAMVILHNIYSLSHRRSTRAIKSQSEQIAEAVEDNRRRLENQDVTVERVTTLSPYETMHEDIFSIAEDKFATIVLLPFDLQSDDEGAKTVQYSGIRNMYQNILASPPCTIGLLVDRGMGTTYTASSPSVSEFLVHRFVMFFIGGPDDREALMYVYRMASNPKVQLTVVRISEGKDLEDPSMLLNEQDREETQGMLNILLDHERQKEVDEEFMRNFRCRTTHDASVQYLEETSNNGEETLEIIKNIMGREMFELCVVGKGDRHISPLTSGLLDLIEFPEIGALADSIVMSRFSDNTSVLVIQSYVEKAEPRSEISRTRSLLNSVADLRFFKWGSLLRNNIFE